MTATEWRETYGGKKVVNPNGSDASFRRLPFDHCSLSLQPFENPLCDTEGHLFDLLAIVPYLKKYKTNPVTGKVNVTLILQLELNLLSNNCHLAIREQAIAKTKIPQKC